jgi:hypothetical protein
VAEIIPALTHPEWGKRLDEVAANLLINGWAQPHPEIHLEEHC